jgi:hypothetical protein
MTTSNALTTNSARLIARMKRKRVRHPSPPPIAQRNFRYHRALLRMNHAIARGHDRRVLRRQMLSPAEQHDIASISLTRIDLDQTRAKTLRQRLASIRLRPIRRVWRHRTIERATNLAPHADDQPEAIAAHTFERALMPIRRAGPRPSSRNYDFPRGSRRCLTREAGEGDRRPVRRSLGEGGRRWRGRMKDAALAVAPSTMLRMVPLPRLRGPKPQLSACANVLLRRAKARRKRRGRNRTPVRIQGSRHHSLHPAPDKTVQNHSPACAETLENSRCSQTGRGTSKTACRIRPTR